MEHVDDLEKTYAAMYWWLKPGGFGSHVVDFRAHGMAPFWNGHWAFSDVEWKLVRGQREFLLNREPLSAHLACARKAGVEVVGCQSEYEEHGLKSHELSRSFQRMSPEDLETSSAMLILRKPHCQPVKS